MHIILSVEKLILSECIRLFQENEVSNKLYSIGTFPESAIVVYNTNGNVDGEEYDNPNTIEAIWEIKDGTYKMC